MTEEPQAERGEGLAEKAKQKGEELLEKVAGPDVPPALSDEEEQSRGDERAQPDREEAPPQPAPKAGLPGGSHAMADEEVSSGSEEVRKNVAGGPASETHGPVAPGDMYGSQLGAKAAMEGSGEADPDQDESEGQERAPADSPG
jgi:hypothetical protein